MSDNIFALLCMLLFFHFGRFEAMCHADLYIWIRMDFPVLDYMCTVNLIVHIWLRQGNRAQTKTT